MFKNLLRVPDTLDPDDRRRRQIVGILLIVFTLMALVTFLITLIFYNYSSDAQPILLMNICLFSMIVFIVLFYINRSTKLPGWFSGLMLILFMIAAISQVDSPKELYDGRSLITWVIPIMISAVIFRPVAVFFVAMGVAVLMGIFPSTDNMIPNYYAIIDLFFIAFLCWLGMSIANRAIRDARRHAANNDAILKSIADGVLVLDLQGNVLSVNPALLRMLSEDEIAQIIMKPLGKTVRWKGKVFSVSISEVPEIGTVAVFRDETRRHETERARDALLATASHELRTPLTAVMNYLEMLQVLTKMGKISTVEFSEHLTRALENIKRLQDLVNNILDQAQIQAGVLTLKRDSFDVRVLIEKAHQLLAVLLDQKHLSYEVTVANEVPIRMSGDESRLHQVLVNLLGNAIKFTNQGSIKVNVSVPLKEKLSIQVADSGPGIPPEQLPDIFEAFRRGSDYVQRERQGAGLGLSIAKEIVTRMGGEISVSSELGRGSVFTILLPMEAV